MIDVDKCVKECMDGLTYLNKEQKTKFYRNSYCYGEFFELHTEEKGV